MEESALIPGSLSGLSRMLQSYLDGRANPHPLEETDVVAKVLCSSLPSFQYIRQFLCRVSPPALRLDTLGGLIAKCQHAQDIPLAGERGMIGQCHITNDSRERWMSSEHKKLMDSILFNANTRPFTIHTWTQAHKTMYRDSGSLQHVFLGELVLTTTQMAATAACPTPGWAVPCIKPLENVELF